MIAEKNNIFTLQQKVIKWTYLLLLISLIISLTLFDRDVMLSIILGTAISLWLFNNKFKLLKKNTNVSKLPAKQLFNSFLNYGGLFLLLVIVKRYTDLNVWVVLSYLFICNILLIFAGISELIKVKGK